MKKMIQDAIKKLLSKIGDTKLEDGKLLEAQIDVAKNPQNESKQKKLNNMKMDIEMQVILNNYLEKKLEHDLYIMFLENTLGKNVEHI